MKQCLKIIAFSFLPFLIFSQELPPIEIFTPEEYGGKNQNWMISQASNKYIYVANSEGLLEFNGAKWKMYPSPNKTDIRAVNVVNDRIYTGCYMEFGYWIKDSSGNLKYYSLVDKLNKTMVEDENIWNILSYQEWVIFQSQERIYFYNSLEDDFKIINSDNIINKVFNVNNTIYYYVANEGIYKIDQGEPKLVTSNPIIKSNRVINLFSLKNNLLIQTHKSGFYLLKDGDEIQQWHTSATNVIKTMSVFNSIQLEDKSFVLGTISNGIVYLNKEGEIEYQINQKNGLSNNTALSLFEDIDKNLWVGLDNGINCVNIKSPIRVYNDEEGALGTIYASTIFNDYLYLGTNQGLFYKNLNISKDSFHFIKGTAGQVWNLFTFNNEELFCGHHLGTFIVKKDEVSLIDSTPGAWNFKLIANTKNTLLQGNYSGLYILQKENGQWKQKNKIEGFSNSARYFELIDNKVWVSHGYKGVFKLELDDSFSKVIANSMETELLIGQNSSLITYKKNLLYAFREGVFNYDTISNSFKFDSIISPLIEKDVYLSGKLVVDKNDKLWGFSKDNINYITTDNLTAKYKINHISIPSYLRKCMIGYENISNIDGDKYLVGTANGYITIDLSKIDYDKDYNVILNGITLKNIGKNDISYNANDSPEFNYKPSAIVFNYSVPEYDKYLIVKYQYKLDGQFNKWSDWSENSKISFENLSFGDYTLNIKAKVGNEQANNIVNYNFTIDRPWFLTNMALIAYAIILFLMILLTHKAYKKYYNKQLKNKQLANEQLIVKMKNEKLNLDINNKNRELAISTMSIIKKNEVLSSIKKELKSTKLQPIETQSIIKLIDSNLNNAKDWKFFEEAFNNADKDFLDKIKNVHPELTPNDLRFCAYLRLNLSSKEIAPLLNISVRSVEIKRYRLRKKMNLSHSEGLINHILNI